MGNLGGRAKEACGKSHSRFQKGSAGAKPKGMSSLEASLPPTVAVRPRLAKLICEKSLHLL